MRLRHICTVGSVVCISFGAPSPRTRSPVRRPPWGPSRAGPPRPRRDRAEWVHGGDRRDRPHRGDRRERSHRGDRREWIHGRHRCTGASRRTAPIVLGKGQSPGLRLPRAGVRRRRPAARSSPTCRNTQVASVSGGTVAGIAEPGRSRTCVVPGDTRRDHPRPRRGARGRAAERSSEIIWAANKIIGRPYVYGGGHRSFISYGYDCSGTVSFALHGGAPAAARRSTRASSWPGATAGRASGSRS